MAPRRRTPRYEDLVFAVAAVSLKAHDRLRKTILPFTLSWLRGERCNDSPPSNLQCSMEGIKGYMASRSVLAARPGIDTL